MFTLPCYIGLRYNGTRLYIKANYNTHSPLKVCWAVSKYWRLSIKQWNDPSGCVVQHQSKCICCYSIVQQKLCIICFDQLCDTYSEFPLQIARVNVLFIYRHISNIRCTKSHNWNVSCLVLQLSLRNPLKQGVKSRMKTGDVPVGAEPTGDDPTTFERSTNLLPTKVQIILEVWWYISDSGNIVFSCKCNNSNG